MRDGVGEQAVDTGDHPRQRPAGEADRDEAGEGEGDGAGLVGPVEEQPQGDDDDAGLGGDGHPPADPLHPPPVLGPGLDVADVGARTGRSPIGSEPEQDERPGDDMLTVGEQGEADRCSGDVAGEHGVAPDRGGQPAVGQAEQQVQGDRRQAGRREAQRRLPRPTPSLRRGRWAIVAAASVPSAATIDPPRTIGASRSCRRRSPSRSPAAAHSTTRIGRTISTGDGPVGDGDHQGRAGEDHRERRGEQAVGRDAVRQTSG